MIGRKIIFKETLDSTNNYAANLLEKGELAHGTVIMSGEQTAGRGQRGSSWLAEPYKNLIFTCFLEYDNLSVLHQQSVTHLVSLAIVDLLAEKGMEAQIKWPNDILSGTAKIAGVLIENQISAQQLKSNIIGIGLNVNQTEFGDFNATSMQLLSGEFFSLESVSWLLIEKLQRYLDMLRAGELTALEAAYLEKLWLKDMPAPFEDAGGTFEGIIRGTDASGKLIVEKEDQLTAYDLKEIKFLMRNAPSA